MCHVSEMVGKYRIVRQDTVFKICLVVIPSGGRANVLRKSPVCVFLFFFAQCQAEHEVHALTFFCCCF